MSDHIRAVHGGPFACLNCGEEYAPTYPCPIGAWRALSEWFTRTHGLCLPLRQAEAAVRTAAERLRTYGHPFEDRSLTPAEYVAALRNTHEAFELRALIERSR